MGNLISNLRSNERHEWNLKDFPKYLFIRWEGIIFHSWKFSSQSFRSQEHCKLIFLEDISTCFNPLFSKLLHNVLWLIFGHYKHFLNSLKFFYQSIWNDSQKCKVNNFRNSNESIFLFQKRSTCSILFTVSRKLFCTLRVLL